MLSILGSSEFRGIIKNPIILKISNIVYRVQVQFTPAKMYIMEIPNVFKIKELPSLVNNINSYIKKVNVLKSNIFTNSLYKKLEMQFRIDILYALNNVFYLPEQDIPVNYKVLSANSYLVDICIYSSKIAGKDAFIRTDYADPYIDIQNKDENGNTIKPDEIQDPTKQNKIMTFYYQTEIPIFLRLIKQLII